MTMLAVLAAAQVSTTILHVDLRSSSDPAHGKFVTVQAAVEWLRHHPKSGMVEFLVAPGVYEVEEPIVIGPDLKAPHITIRAAKPGTRPVIDGARPISGWTVQPNGWWSVKLPDVAAGRWYFSDLFVNGHRRFRPRLPRSGYCTISETVPPTSAAAGHGFDRFGVLPNQIDPRWSNLGDIELDLFHNWFITHGRIGTIEGSTVTLKAATGFEAGWADLAKGNRFLVDNVKEALGRPGDWYLDRPTGILTYIPEPGERPTTADVRAPIAPDLLEVKGDLDRGVLAPSVTVDGLEFRHTMWNVSETGRSFPQAEADLRGAIRFSGATLCRFDNCVVTQVGEYAVEIGPACSGIEVYHCRLHDLGAGGVKIGTPGLPATPAQATSNVSVHACEITSGGRRAPAAVGIWIGQSAHNVVHHNTIEDFYYTGVSVGWTWGYGPSGANDNEITDNRIGLIGQGVLSDMGGIYTLGVAAGTVLSGNYIHDVSSFSYGGWGIYPDEGSSGLLITKNFVTRCKSAGFHQHYGQDNTVRGNVFAFNVENQLMRTRAEDHRSFTFDHNVVIWDSGNLLGSNWTGNGFQMDENLYWRTDGKPYDFAGQSLAQWQARGQDVHSLFTDPLFADARRGDLRLRHGSPLAKWSRDFLPAPDIVKTAGARMKPLPIEPKAWP